MWYLCRQRTSSKRHCSTIKRPSANLLSDASLFLSDSDSSDLELVDIEVDDSENEHSEEQNPRLRTPRATTKTYSALTSGTRLYDPESSECPSASPSSLSTAHSAHSTRSAVSSVDIAHVAVSVSMLSLATDEASVIYGFLNFGDVVQMSKTCSRLHALSFKLLSKMTIRCKSLYGVGPEPLNMLIARCSHYLKHLDLSQVATAVTDLTVRTIATHCSHLNVVSLHGCMALTDGAMVHFLESCPFLRDLDLSGCHQLSGAIGGALSMCFKLQRLNLSWCNSMDVDIVPYLLLMNERGALRECSLHSTNRYVSLFMAFEECFAELEGGRTESGTSSVHKLKNTLRITGGLQSKYTDDDALRRQIEYLEERNISFVDPRTVEMRSISECDFKHKLDLLCSSTTVFSWRWYTQFSSNKVYLVMHTEFGIFGTKLLPLLDFTCSRVWYFSHDLILTLSPCY